MDSAEKQILDILQQEGRLPNVELAERVGLSESPTYRRVKQLESDGVIEGYAAVVSQRALGLDVTAFVQVTMEKQPDRDVDAFRERVRAEPWIVECFATSGSHDYLMKVVARSIDHFSEICMQRILKFPGVLHIESSFSLTTVKNSRVLPVSEHQT